MANSTIDRFDPLGFYHMSEDFLLAAKQISKDREEQRIRLRFQDNVSYHLHCHSIELALKAFLRAREVSNEELKRHYSHNLVLLLGKALEKGLVLGGDEDHTKEAEDHTKDMVQWLSELGKAQSFRYFETGYTQKPGLAEVQLVNERLLKAVRQACSATYQGKSGDQSGAQVNL